MRGLLIIVALLAGSCSDQGASNICGSLPMLLPHPVATADDQMQSTTYCVERWAARLSHAPDAASHVVEAVLAACDGAISALEAARAKEEPGSEMPLDAARAYWRKRAQFIVVQTRAGDCYPDA